MLYFSADDLESGKCWYVTSQLVIYMAAKIKTFRSRFWGSDFTSIAMTIEMQNMMEMLFYNKGSKICLLLEYLFSNCHQYYQHFHLISIGNIGKINICKIVQG